MELRDIEYFAVVAEHGSIGRAADALNMSQPALSKSLRRLEQSIRAKVVQRTTKGVELTTVGRALLAQVHRLRLTMDDISREATDLSEGRMGHLRICAAPSFAPQLVQVACEALLKEEPRVTLKLTFVDRAYEQAGLRNGTLDLAVTAVQMTPAEDLVEVFLYEEDCVVFASANHSLAKRKQLSLADLVNERWVMSDINNPMWQRLSQAFGKAGLRQPQIGAEITYLSVRQHLVATTGLLSFASREVVRDAAARYPIVELRVKDFSSRRRVGVIYRKDAYLPPVGRRFIEILQATAKKISAGKSWTKE